MSQNSLIRCLKCGKDYSEPMYAHKCNKAKPKVKAKKPTKQDESWVRIFLELQKISHTLDRLEDRWNELGERQRVIESDIEKIQKYMRAYMQLPRVPFKEQPTEQPTVEEMLKRIGAYQTVPMSPADKGLENGLHPYWKTPF